MRRRCLIMMFALFFVFFLSLNVVSAGQITLNSRPLDASGNLEPSECFTYDFNWTTSSNCSDFSSVVFSNSSIEVVTSVAGDANITLKTPDDYTPITNLCEYRNGSLRAVHTISDVMASNIYANNLRLSGNTTVNSSSGGYGFFSHIGTFLEQVTDGFFTRLNVSGEINVTNVTTNFIKSYDWTNITLTESQISDLQSYILTANEGSLNVNSSDWWDGLNTHSDLNYQVLIKEANISDFGSYITTANEGGLDVNSSDWWDGYNIPDDIQYSALSTNFWNENVDLGANNFSVDTNILFVNKDTNFVGINTSAPSAKLHVQDGAVLFNGTTGSTPTSGAGTRLMWIPEKAAFRAGYVIGDKWNDTNIGTYSFAAGYDPEASGSYGSTAFGRSTIANGSSSVALGRQTTASGAYSMATGIYAEASGAASTAIGTDVTASGISATAIGTNSIASGDDSIAMGFSTTASGSFGAVAMGRGTTASGITSTAMGREIEAGGDYAVAIGLADMNGANVTQANTMAIMGGNVGIGALSPSALLEIAGAGSGLSLNVSDDLFVNDTTGYVGIGTTSPTNLLFVQDDIDDNSGTTIVNYEGGLTLDKGGSNAGQYTAIKLDSYQRDGNYIQSIGNGNNDVDLAIGQYLSTGAQNEYIRILDGGNVGIGTASPGALLHISKNSGGDKLILESKTGAAPFDTNIQFYTGATPESNAYITAETIAGGAGVFHFGTGAKGSPSDKVTIDENGNLGIGTTNPTEELHIYNSGGGADLMIQGHDAGTNLIFDDDGTQEWKVGYNRGSTRFQIKDTTDSNNIPFIIYNGAGNELLVLNESRIGIGTTTPKNTLNVVGDANVTGNFYVGKVKMTEDNGNLEIWLG